MILEQASGPLDRSLYSVSVESPADAGRALTVPEGHFAAFVGWDARGVSADVIGRLASDLFAKGLAYLCCWGPDCERVHDIFDEVEVEEGWDLTPASVVMTTWHASESLEDALWFFVYNSFPDDAYFDTCRTGVAVTIGQPDWGVRVHALLSDLDALKSAVDL